MMIRKYGGYSFQKTTLPLSEIYPLTVSGPDLIKHPMFRLAFVNALMQEDATLLKGLYKELFCQGIALKRFVHCQQETISYEGSFMQEMSMQSKLMDDLNLFFDKTSPFLKVKEKNVEATNIALLMTRLGISTPNCHRKSLKKAHLFLSFFYAMQPGAYQITANDLLGVYFDYNKGKTYKVYPPLQEQLESPFSFSSNLKKILRARNLYYFEQGTLIEVVNTKNKGAFCLLLELPSKAIALLAMNFGKEAISEEISSDYLEKRVALDLFKESSYPKSLDKNRLTLELDPLDTKCLIFTKQDQKSPSFPH